MNNLLPGAREALGDWEYRARVRQGWEEHRRGRARLPEVQLPEEIVHHAIGPNKSLLLAVNY